MKHLNLELERLEDLGSSGAGYTVFTPFTGPRPGCDAALGHKADSPTVLA